jgi:class 3 adenylate cyclase
MIHDHLEAIMPLTIPTTSPRRRAIIAVDVEGSCAKADPAKARVRQVMYEQLEQALRSAMITSWRRDPFLDLGDGALVLIHSADTTAVAALLNLVAPTWGRLLGRHNRAHPDERFRLRVAIHAGMIHYDNRGRFGESLDLTFRLLDAPTVKARLRWTAASMVLVVSDAVYRQLAADRAIDHHGFAPLARIRLRDRLHVGWVRVAGDEPLPTEHLDQAGV